MQKVAAPIRFHFLRNHILHGLVGGTKNGNAVKSSPSVPIAVIIS